MAFSSRALGQVIEAHVCAMELQFDHTNGAVALLANDDFRDSLLLGMRIVILVPVDEHHQVRVLLDCA